MIEHHRKHTGSRIKHWAERSDFEIIDIFMWRNIGKKPSGSLD